MEIVLLLIRLILFGVFALAGIGKLMDLQGSVKAMREFGTPDEFAKTFAIALPFAEIVFAFCFLFKEMAWVGALGSLLLLLTFIGGMLWQISQGKAPDCHCFGQIHSEPVSKKSLIRNVVFAVLALVLIAQGRDRQGLALAETSTEMLQMALIFLLLALAVVLLAYVKRFSDQQSEILRRMGVLELAAGESIPVERHEAGDPNDGLPIGAPLPHFAIPDLNGHVVHSEHLLADKKPLLFFFVGPACEPCQVLLPEVEEWEAALIDKLKFVFVSNGDIEKNHEKFGNADERIVLVEKSREFALTMNAKWTPTALFVDADGKVASHVAAGDLAIRRLVEQVKSRDLNDEFLHFLGMNGYGRPKIGQAIPSFSMKDLKGEEITDKSLLGRKTLVAFSSLGCPHCGVLMKQIREWELNKKPDDPGFVIFADGEPEETKTLGLEAPILVDPEYAVAQKFGMHGAPSAVLVNEDGTIITETAVGPPNIWALIGERR
jgi:peroxiredoxin/uncharacterized membrane protein YphA (DoxX/SURF4 family)